MDWTTIFFLTVTVVALLLYYLGRKQENHFWLDEHLPFEEPLSYLEVIKDILKGKVSLKFSCYTGGEPTLYVADPEILRRILVKDFHMVPDRRTFDIYDPIASHFVSLLTGEDWKRVRSVITPAFSTGKIKKMIGLMEECANVTVENLVKAAENQEVVDCKRMFGEFTMDIIANTAFGTKLNSSQDSENVFVRHARSLFNVNVTWRSLALDIFPRLSKLLRIRGSDPVVMDFFVDLTNTVVQKRKLSKEDRGDFLQNLLNAQMNELGRTEQVIQQENVEDERDAPSEECQSFLKHYSKNKTISHEEFIATCVLFFLAGYDTTSTTLAMTAYYLALNPECQQKVIKEVDEVVRDHPDFNYETLGQLKYLDAAISETLRIVPPEPKVERKALQDYYIPEADFTVPKDMIIGIPIYAIHTDPEYFPNPEKYDPERFLPENKGQINPYTYLPFGAGPRNCLGKRFALMEIKVCLFNVFKHVTFEPCAETKIPPEMYIGSGLYQPKNVNLKVVKRNVT